LDTYFSLVLTEAKHMAQNRTVLIEQRYPPTKHYQYHQTQHYLDNNYLFFVSL
jgi:hypothetical protein